MRSLLVAAVMLGAITSSYAADMPVKAAPAPSIMTSAAYNWTGWYVGGNAGYGWGVGTDPGISLSDTSGTGFAAYVAAGGVPTASLQPRGGFGGGQLGYNWQAGSWVYGLEADIQGASMNASSSATVTPPAAVTGTATVEHKLRWFGTVRGRLGYAASNWLFYGTGGLIYGGVTSSLTQSATNGYFATNSTSSTRAGWTLGAGTEVGFWGKWSAKAEYLYFDLGRDSVTILGTGAFTGITYTASQKTAGHLLRAGVNYRF